MSVVVGVLEALRGVREEVRAALAGVEAIRLEVERAEAELGQAPGREERHRLRLLRGAREEAEARLRRLQTPYFETLERIVGSISGGAVVMVQDNGGWANWYSHRGCEGKLIREGFALVCPECGEAWSGEEEG